MDGAAPCLPRLGASVAFWRLQEGDRGEQSPRFVSPCARCFFSFLLLVNSVVFHDAESRCRHAVLKLLAKRGPPGNKPRTARGLRSARGGGVVHVQHSQYRCRCWCWCWLVASAGRAGVARSVPRCAGTQTPSTTLHATRPACTLQPHRPTPRTPQPHLSHTGGSFLISRSVDGPGRWKSWVGGRKQKTKNRGGPGAQPSEPVPVEEKIQILTMQFHELDSKPKSRE